MSKTETKIYLGAVSKSVSKIYSLYTETLSSQAHNPSESVILARKTSMLIIERLLGDTQESCEIEGFERCLEKMLKLSFVPPHIKIPFKGIFEYSKLVEKEDVKIDFVAIQPCLQALSVVVRWYFREFEKIDKVKLTQILGPEVSPDLYDLSQETPRETFKDSWKRYKGIIFLTLAEMFALFFLIVSKTVDTLNEAFYAPLRMNNLINFFEGTLGYPASRIAFTLFFFIVPMLFSFKFKKYLDSIETSGQTGFLILGFFNLVLVLTFIVVFWAMHFLEKITVYI